MIRIAGVNLPDNKHLEIGLTHIFGIGRKTAQTICDIVGVDRTKKVGSLTEQEADAVRAEVLKYKIEGDLRRDIAMNIKRLQEIGTYRGLRHRRGLPVRGQRTKTNARTRKGKSRKSVTK